jgi:hypothetical protein
VHQRLHHRRRFLIALALGVLPLAACGRCVEDVEPRRESTSPVTAPANTSRVATPGSRGTGGKVRPVETYDTDASD